MSDRKVYHVTKGDNGWAVKKEGSSRASSIAPTQELAINKARDLAVNSGLGQVKIHGVNGKIREEHTYGDDPYPPKG